LHRVFPVGYRLSVQRKRNIIHFHTAGTETELNWTELKLKLQTSSSMLIRMGGQIGS